MTCVLHTTTTMAVTTRMKLCKKMIHFSMVSGWNLNFVIIYLLMFYVIKKQMFYV